MHLPRTSLLAAALAVSALPASGGSLESLARSADLSFLSGLAAGGRLLAADAPAPATAEEGRPLGNDLRYVGRSMEYAAAVSQVYALAEQTLLPRIASHAGDWAITLDVDETVLSNYEYQARVTRNGCGYQSSTFDAWIRERAASPLPGAKGFLDRTRALMAVSGRGRIVFITDRQFSQEADTVENMRRLGLFQDGDLMLTKRDRSDTKAVRRACVERGRTGTDARCQDAPPAVILATFGDSFRDHFEYYGEEALTRGRAELEACIAQFRCFVPPNPMYGQWDDQGAAGAYERFTPFPEGQGPRLPAHCPAR